MIIQYKEHQVKIDLCPDTDDFYGKILLDDTVYFISGATLGEIRQDLKEVCDDHRI